MGRNYIQKYQKHIAIRHAMLPLGHVEFIFSSTQWGSVELLVSLLFLLPVAPSAIGQEDGTGLEIIQMKNQRRKL